MTEGDNTMAKKKHPTENISFTSKRRFGIELEFNAFDGRNRPAGGQPKGIDHIACLVAAASPEDGCEIRAYEHTNNNLSWVAKPDASCGLEVVSPPRKGWHGLKDVLSVVSTLSKDEKVQADSRCSVHLHIEIADLNEADLASIVSWWIKCEPVIMDAMPMSRKRNRYCQLIGMNNNFQHDGVYSDNEVLQRVGDVKYYSMNTHQYCVSNRKTIEFRIIEGAGCKDAYLVKQWVRFIIHFVETAVKMGRPKQYIEPKTDKERQELTQWTGLAWLDPVDVLNFLGFHNQALAIPNHRKLTEFALSNGMRQTRNWFLARLAKFMSKHKPGGMRYIAYQQLNDLLDKEKESGNEIVPEKHLSPTELLAENLFGEQYIF